MKNLKHLKAGLLACLLVGISQVSLAQSSNAPQEMAEVQFTPTDPDGSHGAPPLFPPPIFVSLDEEISERPAIALYPVPCRNLLTVEISDENQRAMPLTIYSLTGNVVWSGEVEATQRIDLSALSSGVYILHDGYSSHKFQKL